MKWDSVCLSKEEGNLGVKRLEEFKLALMGNDVGGCLRIRRVFGIEFW